MLTPTQFSGDADASTVGGVQVFNPRGTPIETVTGGVVVTVGDQNETRKANDTVEADASTANKVRDAGKTVATPRGRR